MYEGEWNEGERNGFGILSKINSGRKEVIYYGCWVEGEKQGFGILYSLHSVYRGNFLKNKKHGYGQMWWDSGQHYEGSWKNDKFHGTGILSMGNQ